MYDCVPNLSTEGEYPFLNSFGLAHKLKSKMLEDDELMELVWRNGEVVFKSQNQKTTHNGGESITPLQRSTNNQLFIHEDEMASWLLPYPASRTTTVNPSAHPRLVFNNPTVTSVGPVTQTTTVIGSNETPTTTEPRHFSGARVSVTSGDSGTSTSAKLPPRPPKPKEKPSSEVDSEKRRDRINAKMKALQDLIPRCNKMDKASMLDDAIEYLKSLQQTVQIMSMGYGMVPVMYPGVQPYMPSMPMGMNVDTSMNGPTINQPIINRQIMPYPMQAPISSERPMFPALYLQPASVSDIPIIHTTSRPDPLLNFQVPCHEQQISNLHFYQQYLGAQAALAQNQAAMQQKRSMPKSISEAKSHDDTQYYG